MDASAAPPPPTLTLEQTKEALAMVEPILSDPANKAQLEQVKGMAGQDMMMVMMVVMPLAAQLMAPVLTKFGFPADQGGVMMFFMAAGAHKSDPELQKKAAELRDKFVPESLAPLVQQMMAGGMGGMGP